MTDAQFKKACSIAYELSIKEKQDTEARNSLLECLKSLTDACCDEYDPTSHLFVGIFSKLMKGE